jgi:hypothetical protein
MLKPEFLLQALPVIVIVLAAFFFIVMKMLSRLKPRDEMVSSGAGFDATTLRDQAVPELNRLSGTYAVVVHSGEERFQAEAKEISLAGAFIVCDRPLAVGEPLELTLELASTLQLQATVTWNNSNVPKAEIVAGGMRVRFLDVSAEARSVLLSAPQRPTAGSNDETG